MISAVFHRLLLTLHIKCCFYTFTTWHCQRRHYGFGLFRCLPFVCLFVCPFIQSDCYDTIQYIYVCSEADGRQLNL